MLVLSRKSAEEIVFPALGVTVRVLRTSANGVKLGIEAPKHLQVLRGELASCDDLISTIRSLSSTFCSHELRNRLNALILKLELLRRAEARGLTDADLPLIESATSALTDLDQKFVQLVDPDTHSDIAPSQKLRLLVVDDDANERELLVAVLSMHGFEVTGAQDGVDAIEQLNRSTLPNAVLLDLQMPRLCGEETLRCIRSDKRLNTLKVIGISGSSPRMQVLPDGLAGFDAWFSKPLQLEKLVHLLDEPALKSPAAKATL